MSTAQNKIYMKNRLNEEHSVYLEKGSNKMVHYQKVPFIFVCSATEKPFDFEISTEFIRKF